MPLGGRFCGWLSLWLYWSSTPSTSVYAHSPRCILSTCVGCQWWRILLVFSGSVGYPMSCPVYGFKMYLYMLWNTVAAPPSRTWLLEFFETCTWLWRIQPSCTCPTVLVSARVSFVGGDVDVVCNLYVCMYVYEQYLLLSHRINTAYVL